MGKIASIDDAIKMEKYVCVMEANRRPLQKKYPKLKKIQVFNVPNAFSDLTNICSSGPQGLESVAASNG